MKSLVTTITLLLLISCSDNPQKTMNPHLSPEDRLLAEQQLEETNAAASLQGYYPTAMPIIDIVPHDPRCTDPTAFIVEQVVNIGNPYDNDGTYDYDDRIGWVRICVGGRFIEPNIIKVTLEGIRAGVAVRYETEHKLLYEQDRYRFYATAYHTPDNAHPIFRGTR